MGPRWAGHVRDRGHEAPAQRRSEIDQTRRGGHVPVDESVHGGEAGLAPQRARAEGALQQLVPVGVFRPSSRPGLERGVAPIHPLFVAA